MALIYMDGFDQYNDNDDMLTNWHTASGAINTTSPQNGRASYLIDSNTKIAHFLLPGGKRTSGRLIVGADVYISYGASATWRAVMIFGHVEDAAPLVLQCQNSTKKFRIQNADASIDHTSSGAFPQFENTWTYFEFMIDIGTSGQYEWRVNGLTTLSGTGNTDVNSSGVERAGLYYGGQSCKFDNFYLSDNTGTTNTGFLVKPNLGRVQVHTLKPNGDGHVNDWTPSSGSINYVNVDEDTPDWDTTYNTADANNEKDFYTLEDLPTGTPPDGIRAVQVSSFAGNNNPTEYRKVRHMIYTNATEDAGDTLHSVGQTMRAAPTFGPRYPAQSTIFNRDAEGAAWTLDRANALEVGIRMEA